MHQFKVGMKFEAIDPFNPSHICVVTVIKVLRFNYFVLGVDSLATYFVCHANSINIFPCGWAKTHSLQIHPPRGSVWLFFNKPLSFGGHVESQENKKLCFCTANLALNSRLAEACRTKTNLFIPLKLNMAAE